MMMETIREYLENMFRNLPDTPLNKIHETKVLMTIFKGKVVYERP